MHFSQTRISQTTFSQSILRHHLKFLYSSPKISGLPPHTLTKNPTLLFVLYLDRLVLIPSPMGMMGSPWPKGLGIATRFSLFRSGYGLAKYLLRFFIILQKIYFGNCIWEDFCPRNCCL